MSIPQPGHLVLERSNTQFTPETIEVWQKLVQHSINTKTEFATRARRVQERVLSGLLGLYNELQEKQTKIRLIYAERDAFVRERQDVDQVCSSYVWTDVDHHCQS